MASGNIPENLRFPEAGVSLGGEAPAPVHLALTMTWLGTTRGSQKIDEPGQGARKAI